MAMRLPLAVVGLLSLVAASTVPGHAELPRRPLVSVPLFVTDVRGQSIRNLKAPEIEIAEAGTPKKISSVVFRGSSHRRIALFLDEYHVSAGVSTERIRSAIVRFVENHIRQNDAVIVMKPLDSRAATAAVQGIDAVRRKVSEFAGRRSIFEPRGEFEAQYMSTAPEAAARQRAQVVRAGLETLAISMHEGETEAKALVIVTEGFRSDESSRMRTTTLRSIARAARLANVPVYIIDPSPAANPESALGEPWHGMSTETGGLLFPAGSDLDLALARVAADLEAHYVVEFEGAGREDGRFHGIEVKVKRNGARVRAPSGYWAPFATSRRSAAPRRHYANLSSPHVSGLIQSWFRMAPAGEGRTRVTFSWAPRQARKVTPQRVELSASTFEGDTLHTATVTPLAGAQGGATETSFVAAPGPLQITMAISGTKLLDTDVRYIDVPKLDTVRPYIAAVEFVRPRSLPEFRAMQADALVLPTEAREFQRQDRLLVRVRAFAAAGSPDVTVVLVNRVGHVLLELPRLQPVDGAAQFDLPLARFPRGEYRLQVRAASGREVVTNLVTIRLIG